jgi:hypothetical protein
VLGPSLGVVWVSSPCGHAVGTAGASRRHELGLLTLGQLLGTHSPGDGAGPCRRHQQPLPPDVVVAALLRSLATTSSGSLCGHLGLDGLPVGRPRLRILG